MNVKVIDFHETLHGSHDVRAAQPSYLQIYYKNKYLLTTVRNSEVDGTLTTLNH